MKYLITSAMLACFILCGCGSGDIDTVNDAKTQPQAILSTGDSIRLHADDLLSGKVKPTDDAVTFLCVDKLVSPDAGERRFYFGVFRKILSQSDGALSEYLPAVLQDYLLRYPEEFIASFQQLPADEQSRFTDFLGFEYSATEDSGEKLNRDFEKITHRFSQDSSGLNTLAAIKTAIRKAIEQQTEAEENDTPGKH